MTQLRDIQQQLEFQIHLNLGITTYIILGGQSFSARKLLEVESICVDFRILLSVYYQISCLCENANLLCTLVYEVVALLEWC